MDENWKCLESNPEALDEYVAQLDFDITKFCFYDLFSTEQWAQDSISKPVLGVLLTFPCNEKAYEFKKKELEEITAKGQFIHPDLFFVKQFALNSCGTVAIYHILSNLQNEFKSLLKEESIVNKFVKDNIGKSIESRSEAFVKSKEIKSTHSDAVEAGTTTNFVESNNHFVAFINFSGTLYEMDGTKEFPINHGLTSDNTFLTDTCLQIDKFMQRDPDNYNFSLIALAKKNTE